MCGEELVFNRRFCNANLEGHLQKHQEYKELEDAYEAYEKEIGAISKKYEKRLAVYWFEQLEPTKELKEKLRGRK